MTDEIWRRDEVQSPCVKICLMHPDAKICLGCHRSIEEIARWSQMSDTERRAVLDALPARSAALTQRRGGRQARLDRAHRVPDRKDP